MDEEQVKELIQTALGTVNAQLGEQRDKNEEAIRVIAEQAREIAALKEKNKKKEAAAKPFCKYGSDGRGAGSTWPARDVNNEPDLTDPHHYDISSDLNYQKCVGKFGAFKHEFRTLAAIGSYLSDFRREVEASLAELRESDNEDLKKEGEELTNTLDGVLELVKCRFGYVVEFTRADADKYRLEALWKKLYPREGTAAPASKLDAWNAEFDKAQDTATNKLLAQLAAKASVGSNQHDGGNGSSTGGPSSASTVKPRPRFQKRG